MIVTAAAPLALAGALVSIPAYLLSMRGMPREGEVARGSRRVFDTVFQLTLAVMSISLLWFAPLARDPLSRLEPLRSNRALLEWTCAFIPIVAVLPLLAILGSGFVRRTVDSSQAPVATLGQSLTTALGRFLLGLAPMLTLQWCILYGARSIGSPVPVQSILADFEKSSLDVRLALGFLLVVAGPLVEETLFRGTLHPALSRVVGADVSRLATSAFFGALHGVYAGIPTGLFGYFLARVRDAHGRLVPCIAIHGLYNLLTLVLYLHPADSRSLPVAVILASGDGSGVDGEGSPLTIGGGNS